MSSFRKLLMFVSIFTFLCLVFQKDDYIFAKEELKYEENSVLALNYHRVRDDNFLDKFLSFFSNSKELYAYSVTSTEFEAQIKWLKDQNAHFLTEEELLKFKRQGKFPDKSVWINFDDMDKSIYKNAHPILKKYEVPATGFVITGEVGSKDFHNLNMATEEELIEMKDSGIWSFASHTHDLHTLQQNDESKLVSSSNKTLTADLEKSNHYLKSKLGIKNQTLAYPYGQMKESKIAGLKGANIKYGYTLEESPITPDHNDYYLPRILISEDAFNTLIKEWEGFKNE